jgi:hypothetical protein
VAHPIYWEADIGGSSFEATQCKTFKRTFLLYFETGSFQVAYIDLELVIFLP